MVKGPSEPVSVNTSAKPLPYVILSKVPAAKTQWLWYPYMPRRGLTSIVGDGGYGKSTMVCGIAAALSRGDPLPGQGPMPPQRILMLSAEDGVSEIIKPRLEKLNADMDKIAVYDEAFNLNPNMIERIGAAMKEFDAAIAFLDPLVAYVGSGTDMYKPNEVRDILKRLDKVSKENNAAFVIVHHIKKGMVSSSQHKTLGSVDFVNGVRSMLLVDISKSGQYYVSHVKANWSQKGPDLAYQITDDTFEWQGVYDNGPDTPEISRTPRNKAKNWIVNQLRDGPKPALDVIEAAHKEGINERTLNRAKKEVAQSYQTREGWFWKLNEANMPHPEPIGETAEDILKEFAGPEGKVTVSYNTQDISPQPNKPDIEAILAAAKAQVNDGTGSR